MSTREVALRKRNEKALVSMLESRLPIGRVEGLSADQKEKDKQAALEFLGKRKAVSTIDLMEQLGPKLERVGLKRDDTARVLIAVGELIDEGLAWEDNPEQRDQAFSIFKLTPRGEQRYRQITERRTAEKKRHESEMQYSVAARGKVYTEMQRGARGYSLDVGCGAISPLDGIPNVVFVERDRELLKIHKRYMPDSDHVLAEAGHLPFIPGAFKRVYAPFLLDSITLAFRSTMRDVIEDVANTSDDKVCFETDKLSGLRPETVTTKLAQLGLKFTVDADRSPESIFIEVEKKQ